MSNLHILTPRSKRTPSDLALEGAAAPGDLIADLRRFPCTAHEVGTDLTCLDITASLLSPSDYWTVAREWLKQFTEQVGLQDLLAIDGCSFWWTLNSLKFVPTLSDLGNMFAWIDLLDVIYRNTAPDIVIVYGQHDPILYLTGQICRGADIHTQVETEIVSYRKTRLPSRVGLVAVRVIISVAFLIYSLFRRPQACFFSSTNLLRSKTVGSKQELYDIYLADVARAFQERGWRIAFVEKFGPNASWRGLMARGFFFPTDAILLLSAPWLYELGLYRRVVRKWRKKWQDARSHVVSHLHYRGYDITSLVLPLLHKEFVVNAPNLQVVTDMWRRVLKIWRPRFLYINASYGRSALPAIVAAKSLNILTIEQQHGIISKNHSAYLVPLGKPPLCDTMLVWGEYTKRLLVNADVYEPEQIGVCGFSRVDALLGELPARSETLRRLGIPPDGHVVLYTSNMIAHGFLSQILDSIQSTPDHPKMYWIIKLHPREKTRDVWEAAIRQRRLQTVWVVEGEFDFYALLTACDIHVSFMSTTLIESAVLGKINLGLEFERIPDPTDFAEADAYLPVAPTELGATIADILSNPERQKHLLTMQKAFAMDWCVHDGQAVSRIVAHVERLSIPSNRERRLDNAAL